jgi:hypothetical protein
VSDAENGELLNPAQIVALINSRPLWRVGRHQVYRLLKGGEIPAVRMRSLHKSYYLARRSDVVAWQRRMEGATAGVEVT